MKKKVLSVLLAVCLLAVCLPVGAGAAEKTYWFENVKATVDGTHVVVTGDGYLNLPGKRIYGVMIDVEAADKSWSTAYIDDYSSEVVSDNRVKVYYDINKTFDFDKPLLPNKEYRFQLHLEIQDIATGGFSDDTYDFLNFSSPVYTFKTGSKVYEPSKPTVAGFSDVYKDDYYAQAVEWAVESGVTSGTDKTHFSPNAACTRAQAVTFLWRAAGEPEPQNTDTAFDDVEPGSYYEKAVQWAVEHGITSGTGEITFSPSAKCTRAQIVTFLYRAENSPETAGGGGFPDVKAGEYYADAVRWAVENEITSGTGGGKFSPEKNCVRGQIVTFLYRYCH